jgi:ribonuclease HI
MDNGIVATDGSLKKCGAMGATFVAKDGRVQARSVAVFGQLSSIRPELTGIALALEECPIEEDLTILTDSLSSMDLLQGLSPLTIPSQRATPAAARSDTLKQACCSRAHHTLHQSAGA